MVAKSFHCIFLLFLMVLVIVSCSNTLSGGDPEAGKRWFALYRCNGCHGPDGVDGKAPELSVLTVYQYRIKKKVRSSDTSSMPSYDRNQVSDQDIADMYQYLKIAP